MNVLFVSTGNKFSYYKGDFSPHVKGPAEALRKREVSIDVFQIRLKGFKGYIKSIPQIKKKFSKN